MFGVTREKLALAGTGLRRVFERLARITTPIDREAFKLFDIPSRRRWTDLTITDFELGTAELDALND